LIILGDRNTAAIQMSAECNKSELARQIAECCCENKALILESAGKTDALIRSLDSERTREALSDAKLKILSLENRIHCDPHHHKG